MWMARDSPESVWRWRDARRSATVVEDARALTRQITVSPVLPPTLLLLASCLACTAVKSEREPTHGSSPAGAPTEQTPATDAVLVDQDADREEPPSTSEHGLTVAALREGPLDLVRWNDRPLLLLDGEPVPIDEGGVPQRRRYGYAGLIPRYGMWPFAVRVVAYGEAPGGEAFVVLRQEHERAADVLDVYERTEERWRRQTVEKTWLTEYHAAFVSREGALLGLRAYAPSQRVAESWEEAEADPAELLRALDRARPGFVRLAGAKKVAVPSLPRGSRLQPFAAVTTDDGTIHAIAEPIRSEDDPAAVAPMVLLAWPPGTTEPRSSALPRLREYPRPSLSPLGNDVLVGGRDARGRPYVLLGRAQEVEPVPILDAMPDGTVSSAAREPDGRIWIVIGDDNVGGRTHSNALWTRSPDGAWSRVPLYAPSTTPENEGKRWAWDADEMGWTRSARRPIAPGSEAAANRVVWAGGALWIVADLGALWDDGDAFASMAIHRSALYTTANVAAPVRLEPVDLNRVALLAAAAPGAEPGEQACRTFSIVLGTEARARTLTSADLAAIEATESLSGITTRELYVARTEHGLELVLTARAYDSKAARSLIRSIGAAFRKAVRVECGPRRLVEMIRDFDE